MPLGGVKKMYRQVDILNCNGFAAAIAHPAEGFRCTWFPNNTRISYFSTMSLKQSDIVVQPEDRGLAVIDVAPGVPKVILNQNCYYSFRGHSLDKENLQTPYRHNEFVAAIVVSEDSKEYLKYVFPSLNVFRIHYSIDPCLYYHEPQKKRKRIGFMPRKNGDDVLQVINILKHRNVLAGFDLVPIENKSDSEAASMLRECLIFLSFGYPEGFGLPAAEALACGCLTIGYHGRGGKEFFKSDFAWPIEQGDTLHFARAVEGVVKTYEADPGSLVSKAQEASSFIKQTYSPEREATDIVQCWRELTQSIKGV